MKIRKEVKSLLFLIAGIIVLAIILLFQNASNTREAIQEQVQEEVLNFFEERDELLQQSKSLLSSTPEDSIFKTFNALIPSQFSNNTGVLIFDSLRMVFWSNNSIPLSNNSTPESSLQGLQFIKNGWYDFKTVEHEGYAIVSFVQIFKAYNHENQYLKNGFVCDISGKGIKNIEVLSEALASWSIYDENESYLFSIVFNEDTQWQQSNPNLITIIWLLVIILGFKLIEFLLLVRLSFLAIPKSILLIFLVVVVRYLMIHLKIPVIMYSTGMFDPINYAYSNAFPSIGDLLLNALSGLYIVYLFNKFILSEIRLSGKNLKPFSLLIVLITYLIIFSLGIFVSQLTDGGVQHSTINFDVSDIFRLNYLSYIGLIAVGLLHFVYFLILDKAVIWLLKNRNSSQFHIIAYFLVCAFYFLMKESEFNLDNLVKYFWSYVVFILILVFKKNKRLTYSFSKLIIIVLVFSISASIVIAHGGVKREKQEREYLASKLITNNDPVVEYLFHELSEEIVTDTVLKRYASNFWRYQEEIQQIINSEYLTGYWDKYDIQIVGCTGEDSIFITRDNESEHCFSYFNNKISQIAEPTVYGNLFHEKSEDGIASYIGRILFKDTEQNVALFVEFRSKPLVKSEGYPELLLGQREIDRSLNLQDYSFAKYFNGELINSNGNYSYPLEFEGDKNKNHYYFSKEDYSHYVNGNKEGITVVLSRKINRAFKTIILFSFLFSLFLLIFFINSLLIPEFPVQYNFSLVSFGSKLQLLLIGVILIIVIPFGIGVVYYINGHYDQRNDKNITEKISSVLTEIEHKIGNEEYIPENIPPDFQNYLNQILIKFSNVFYTDINLYGLNGNLIATSRMEVFDIGLKGSQMNVDAFETMAVDRKSLFIHNEEIGNLSYLSAYVPFRNYENESLAYLNLPYFAKQNELEKELSGFLIALVNIYIFLIALAIAVSVVFVDYLSKPLKLIGRKISQLRLGSENELIQWEGDDEIGALVEEYNRMVIELANNVDLLAKSEREGAWREMAKQVAHEIKNPLTPMKLSVQHLQRASAQNSENIKENIDKVSKTLIEQIDSLTRIADEFSGFAKMPAARNEVLNIFEILKSSIDLFNDEDVPIKYSKNTDKLELLVHADKDQMMRVFNNIIKNAIQSIPDKSNGEVEILINEKEEMIIVSISDNGIGISKEEASKIFTPNFTTKSGGMGLGLSMVKNIIENCDGSVSFESKLGKGTIFTVKLPIYYQ